MLTALDLLDLLWIHQGSLATRAFSDGNREYQELLIRSSQQLVAAIRAAPASAVISRATLLDIATLVERQDVGSSRELSSKALDLIVQIRDRHEAQVRAPGLYARTSLPRLPKDYDSIVVLFGGAMGLGDQITFYQFLRRCMDSCSRARGIVYTLYPGLWPRMLPRTEEVSFRDDPLLPFARLNRPEDQGRQLVITADYELIHLHHRVIARRPGRDVLELSLGRRSAWFNQAGSPWTFFEAFWSLRDNNYMFMHQLSSRLVPSLFASPPWIPARPRVRQDLPVQTKRRWWQVLPSALRKPSARVSTPAAPDAAPPRIVKTVLVNPFTSKELPYGPYEWAEIVKDVQRKVAPGMELHVVVYPGVEERTRAMATELCAWLGAGETPMVARLLKAKDGPLTPHTGLPTLLDVVGTFDLCITADTFTAHLVPLFGVCTVVLAYNRFRKFWVPCRWVFNHPASDFAATGPALVAEVLQQVMRQDDPDTAARAAALARATEKARVHSLDLKTLRLLESALADVFQHTPPKSAHYTMAKVWLMLWSRLTGAMEREGISGGGLMAYLDRWEDEHTFKFLALPG